jgi:hypothetical protein
MIEINSLKSLIAQIHNWLSMYRRLQEKEEEYYSIMLNTSGAMKKHYKKKMKLITKRLNQLSKRINFTNMMEMMGNIEKRLSVLYEFDRLQKDD